MPFEVPDRPTTPLARLSPGFRRQRALTAEMMEQVAGERERQGLQEGAVQTALDAELAAYAQMLRQPLSSQDLQTVTASIADLQQRMFAYGPQRQEAMAVLESQRRSIEFLASRATDDYMLSGLQRVSAQIDAAEAWATADPTVALQTAGAIEQSLGGVESEIRRLSEARRNEGNELIREQMRHMDAWEQSATPAQSIVGLAIENGKGG